MRLFSLSMILAIWAAQALPMHAQCPGCEVNFTCSIDPAYPTLCPAQPPNATAGQAYQTDITFWLPSNFDDPGTGFNVDFLMMTITGVSGLPYGLDIEYSDPLGVYYPQQSAYGCARICGTPISAGSYGITISIIAQVEYSNLTLNVPQQFTLPLIVEPGSGSNTGFTFTPTNGCGNAEVAFAALIDGQGAPVTYAWDFGNGNTGTSPSSTQTYDAPGTYGISLQTTIGGYVLNNVNVGGVNDNWCGDVEEIELFGSCQGSPDIYFVLTDGQGGTYESSHGEDSGSESWSGLNITLGTPPYAIEFWDEDPVSVDDALGTYNIPLTTEGEYPFNVAGGTFGSLHIDLVAQQVFNDTDSVVVFAAPQPIINFDTLAASICVIDTGLVSITWFNDGDTALTGNLPCVNADSTGTWWAVVNNGFGCTTVSDTVVICPTITIEQSGDVLYTETGLDDYSWSWNGQPIADADGPFFIAETGGTYTVTATNADGCLLSAEYVLVITSIATSPADAPFEVFPNPNDGRFTVRSRSAGPGTLLLFDARGQLVLQQPFQASPVPTDMEIDLPAIPAGTYIACFATDARSSYRSVIVR